MIVLGSRRDLDDERVEPIGVRKLLEPFDDGDTVAIDQLREPLGIGGTAAWR